MTGLASATGFLTIPLYYYGEGPASIVVKPMQLRKNPPGDEVQCVSVPDWGTAYLAGKLDRFGGDLLTPLQVADNLDSYADAVHAALPKLQAETGDNVELRDLLWDLESMALLGSYCNRSRAGARKIEIDLDMSGGFRAKCPDEQFQATYRTAAGSRACA